MRKALAIGVVAAPLLLAAVVRSQSLPIAEFDFKAAETQLKDANPVVHHKSLHDAEREPDGTKGFGLPQPEVYRVALPNPPPPLVLAMAPGEDGQSFTSAKMAIFQDNAWQRPQEMSMEAYLSMTPSFQYTVPDAPYRFVVMQRMIVPAANENE